MERVKWVLKKLFCLRPLPTVFIAVPSFVFVFYMLGTEEHSVWTYVSYGLSAYALVISVTGTAGIVKAIRKGFDGLPLVKKIRCTPWGRRLLGDAVFRSEVTLHGGLVSNLLYVALNLVSGIRYRSPWFLSLAFYYLMLSVMRGVLACYVRQKEPGQDIPAELRRSRACGVLLLLMNQALVGIVVYIVTEDRGFSYPGVLIYAMAAYTFYITTAAIINVVRFRKYGSPVLSAAKVISLTAALVSMLSLETAMLSQFGDGDLVFRRVMTAASGGGVCAVVLVMAVFMIGKAVKELKKEKLNISET